VQPQNTAAAAAAAAAAADAPCNAKCISGVGYSRLQRGDSMEQQQQQQEQAEATQSAAAAAVSVADAAAVAAEPELQAEQQQGSSKVLSPDAAAAVDAQLGSQPTRIQSATLLSNSSLLSPFWVAATEDSFEAAATAEYEAAAEVQQGLQDLPGAPIASAAKAEAVSAPADAAAKGSSPAVCATAAAAAAAAPVTVEEYVAASEAVIQQLERAFAGVQHTAMLLREAQVPLRQRYSSQRRQ
jgi:hypothetical protein